MIFKKEIKGFERNELEFSTTDPTVVIVLTPMTLNVRKISLNTIESIQKFCEIFSMQKFFLRL